MRRYELRKANAMKLDDYVQIKVASALLGVSMNTMRNWERTGKIATYRHPVNGYRLYKKSDLQDVLAAIVRSDQPKTNNPGS